MVRALIVVNGVPGSGKSTLAAPLSRRLDVPLVAKDAIKEALFDAAGGGLPTRELGGIALDVLWRLAALHEGTVMVESFWSAGRDDEFFRRGYASIGRPPGVELWCRVPLEVAAQRFRSRPRHAAHDDRHRVDEMLALVVDARPISGLPVLPVDTAGPVDLDRVVEQLHDLLPSPA